MKFVHRIVFASVLSASAMSLIGCGGSETTIQKEEKVSLIGQKVAMKRLKTKQYVTGTDGKLAQSGEAANFTGIVKGDDVKDTEDYLLIDFGAHEYWVKTEDVVSVDQAAKYFTSIIDSSPQAIDTIIAKANMNIELGRIDNAITDYTDALKVQPSSVAILQQRAKLFESNGDFLSAKLDYDRLYKLESAAKYRVARARCLNGAGDSEKALFELADIIEKEKKNVQSFLIRAEIWEARKEYQAAELDFDRAIKIDSRNVEIFNNRANYYVRQKQHAKALNDLNTVLKIDVNNIEALSLKSVLLSAGHDFKIRDAKTAVELATKANTITGGRDPLVLDALALAHASLGNYADAGKFEKLALENPLYAKKHAISSKKKMDSFTNQLPFMLD
jgi:tetratricopeptide (TPR) repeat protein